MKRVDLSTIKTNTLVRDKTLSKYNKLGLTVGYVQLSGKEKVAELNKLLEQKVAEYMNVYDKTLFQNEDDCESAVKILIDVEEIIKEIATENRINWVVFYDAAKMIMFTFSLEESCRRYLENTDMRNLVHIEASLFEELKQLNKKYTDFQDSRVRRRGREGAYKEGYFIKSVNYNKEQGLNR